MIAKIWKKLLLVILLVLCLFNIVNKIGKRNSIKQELKHSVYYINQKK